MLLKEACLCNLHRKVKTSLTSECRKNAVRLLLYDNLLKRLDCERLDIYLISDILICHNRSRVGVYKYYLNALLLERTACLCSRIVKLSSLSDYNRT